jgi:hypothetical protein
MYNPAFVPRPLTVSCLDASDLETRFLGVDATILSSAAISSTSQP